MACLAQALAFLDPEDAALLVFTRQEAARCPFVISRLAHAADAGQVLYNGKTTGATKAYSALDFLAKMIVRIPASREQTARYFCYCSNQSRGQRKKTAVSGSEARKVLPAKKPSVGRACLIAKVFLADPLCCPECPRMDEDCLVHRRGCGDCQDRKSCRALGTALQASSSGQDIDGPIRDSGDGCGFGPLSLEPDYDHCRLLPREFEFGACWGSSGLGTRITENQIECSKRACCAGPIHNTSVLSSVTVGTARFWSKFSAKNTLI